MLCFLTLSRMCKGTRGIGPTRRHNSRGGVQWFNTHVYKRQAHSVSRQAEVTATKAVRVAKQFQQGACKRNAGKTGTVKKTERQKRQDNGTLGNMMNRQRQRGAHGKQTLKFTGNGRLTGHRWN